MTDNKQELTLYFCKLARGNEVHTYLCLRNTTGANDGYGSVYEHMHVIDTNGKLEVTVGGGLNITDYNDTTEFFKLSSGGEEKILSLWQKLKESADTLKDETRGSYFPDELHDQPEVIGELLTKVGRNDLVQKFL